jgi:hypothetical protein
VKKHLYNTTFGKVQWFIKRFGAAEVVMKPLRLALAPVIIPLLPKRTFEFQGRRFDCFYHRYNMTWAAERCVEIPIARNYLEQCPDGNALEVGNVLSHYSPVRHDVLDKFEKGAGVINEDILDYRPGKLYDLILSISTFEHIGFDDESEEPSGQKIKTAIAKCRELLKPEGTLVLTVPVGYNPELDDLVRTGGLNSTREFYLHRTQGSQWQETTKEEALRHRFKSPFPYANAIIIAEFARA